LSLRIGANPVRGRTEVTLTLDQAQAVTVAAFDAVGRRVATLHMGQLAAGVHAMSLDAAALAPGTYVLHVAGNGVRATARFTVSH
jgi:hypothetical protein